MTKSFARKVTARKPRKGNGNARDKHHKTAPKVAEKVRKKVAAETVRNTHQKTVAGFAQFRDTQVPDALRVLAERNVAQTRELYERSKQTLQLVLDSWQKSFGAAGQGSLAFNQKIIDIAERNINTGFDLATGIAGAKNLAEVMELQAAYWRKLLGGVHTQVEAGRGASPKTRVQGSVGRRSQLT